MAKRLNEMSDQEFNKAFDKFKGVLERAEKDAAAFKTRIPPPVVLDFLKKHEIPFRLDDGWDILLPKLREIHKVYEQEERRRYGDGLAAH